MRLRNGVPVKNKSSIEIAWPHGYTALPLILTNGSGRLFSAKTDSRQAKGAYVCARTGSSTGKGCRTGAQQMRQSGDPITLE
jgi:hypothetical protein